MRKVLAIALLMACVSEVSSQTTPPQPVRTMASLLKEGYEMQRLRVFKENIWMRKPDGDEKDAYICQRGALGSATFDAYRAGNYDKISCSSAQ